MRFLRRNSVVKKDMPRRDIKKSDMHRGNIPQRNAGKSNIKRDVNMQKRPAPVGKMNIQDQTVAKRRDAIANKRIDPHSPEVKRSVKTAQGYKIKQKKKGISRQALAYTVLFCTVLLVVSLICIGIFCINLYSTEKADYSRIGLKLGLHHEIEEMDDISVDVGKYYRNGVFYVNMTAVAEEFGFILTGDHRELRFITDEERGEEVRFLLGTNYALVNGSGINLEAPVYNEDGKVFLPASFISEYMKGIEFSFNEEESLMTISRNTARNEAGRFVSETITFRLKSDRPSASLVEGELTEEEKAKCYFKSISAEDNIS